MVAARVRAAQPADAGPIARVHVASWQHAYRGILPDAYLASLSVDQRSAMWAASIANGSPTVLVAEADETVAGFAAIGPCRDADAAGDLEIWAIYLAPDYWSQGLGHALWRASHAFAIQRSAGRLSLWVFANNPRARRFYERSGARVEPGSVKTFVLGGVTLEEVRYVLQLNHPEAEGRS